MKTQVDLFILLLLLSRMTVAQQTNIDIPTLTGPYLGQKPPGIKPEVFGEKLGTDQFQNGGFVFNRSGDEVFFFAVDWQGKNQLRHSCQIKGVWSNPQTKFTTIFGHKVHPFFFPDGEKVFFGSDARIKKNEKVPYFNLWVSEKEGGVWREPEPLPKTINTGWENCGSFAQGGILIFRRVNPVTRGDLYQSVYLNGSFTAPVKLPKEINTVYDESHPAISFDGRYLVFSSKRPDGFNHGKDELWVVYIEAGGRWSKAVNLGHEINTGCNTSCATISPDGKYVFFIRIENNMAVPYWVSAKIIEELRPKE